MIRAAAIALLFAAPAAAQTVPSQVADPLRPWCRYDGLNPTERAICATPILAQLDAELARLYGRPDARLDDGAQQNWLRARRNACGSDVPCILGAYLNRITELYAISQ